MASDTVEAAIARVVKVFPGAELMSGGLFDEEPADTAPAPAPAPEPAPVKRRRPDPLPAAVGELVASVDEMIKHFREKEPARLERGGWKRIVEALEAVQKSRQIDPEETGGPSQIDHPPTSRAAAEGVRAGSQHLAALEALDDAEDGLTGFELAKHPAMVAVRPDMPPNQACSRLAELRERGLVELSTDERGNVRTRMAAASEAEVNVITAAGATELYRVLDGG